MPWGSFVRPRRLPELGYTSKDLATALGVSRQTIWAMAKDGRLPSMRLGRLLRFPVKALKAALKHHMNLKI